MKKRWLAALLALLMVMGTVGMAAAQEDEVGLEEKEGLGPPAHIREMLEMKVQEKAGTENEDEDDDEEYGPPAFVREMQAKKFDIMNKNKLKIHGNPFVSGLPPVIKHGRTLIPVGAVVKGLGAEVIWEDKTATVTIIKGGTTITLKIGENMYTVEKDGKKEVFEMDTAAEILGNRTFVPLKFIAVALGEEVEWEEETGIINVGKARGQERAAEARLNKDDTDDDDDEELEEEDEE